MSRRRYLPAPSRAANATHRLHELPPNDFVIPSTSSHRIATRSQQIEHELDQHTKNSENTHNCSESQGDSRFSTVTTKSSVQTDTNLSVRLGRKSGEFGGRLVPDTEEALVSKLRDEGIVYSLRRDIPVHVSGSVERLVNRVLQQCVVPAPDMNEEVFWVVHPGGRGILDRVESRLGLREDKLAASRAVMRQYGNTRSSSVVLVMEEMRRSSDQKRHSTAGEGLEWGLVIGYGPGLTVEIILLRALPTNKTLLY